MIPETGAVQRQTNELSTALERSVIRPAWHLAGVEHEEEEPRRLSDLSTAIRLRWRLLTLLALAGASLGGLYYWLRPPLFTATALVEVQQPSGSFLNRGDLDQSASAGGDDKILYLQTKVRALDSDSLLMKTVSLLREQTPEPRPKWMAWPTGNNGGPDERDRIIRDVRKSLSIKLVEETRLIEIAFESGDRRLSANFVNTMAEEFRRQEAENYVRSAIDTTNALVPQMADIKKRLRISEAKLRAYAANAGLLVSSTNENLGDQRVKQGQQELETARAQRMAQQARFEAVATTPPDSLAEVLSDAGAKELRARISQQRQQLADLTTIYSPNHYEVKRVQAQVEELENAYRVHRENMVNQISVAHDVAKRREQLALNAYADATGDLAGQSSRAVEFDVLRRDVDLNRQLYDSTFKKINDGGVLAAVRPNNVRIVDPGFPPSLPSAPRMTPSILIGLLGGLFGGFAIVLVRERPGERFHKSAETAQYLGVPHLGAIPWCPPVVSSGKMIGPTTGSNGKPALSAIQSMFAESCVSVVSSILFNSNVGEQGIKRSITVVSPGRGDGKTTTTVSLGVAFANRGLRTLLIDGDLRRPQLHDLFFLPNDNGLRQFLSGEVWHTAPKSLPIENLFVLPSGGVCDAPAALLNSDRMSLLMQSLRQSYDIILIDSPPAQMFGDARLWASMCDGVVLVVRSGRTSRDDARLVRQRLAEDGSTVIGSVLNDWNPRREGGNAHKMDYGAYGTHT